jgi:3-deoxy-D-manno-octulosonate 8-phosphate phosphatase (KDO 8-P phosphatase)
MNAESLKHIAKRIKLLILDCDGVLTNGKTYFTASGEEIIGFHIHDGFGMKRLQANGVTVAVISGRNNQAVQHRLKQLEIQHAFLGQKDKIAAFHALLDKLQLTAVQVAYVGDDLPDIDVMQQVALPIAVANAVDAIKKIAKMCTQKKGGDGAVREVCDLIYDAQYS